MDDLFIFYKATSESDDQVLYMLNIFEKASGQQINIEKFSIFFSNNTQSGVKQELFQRLGFHEAGDCNLYSGLPYIIGRSKSVVFDFLKERL